MCPMYLLVCGMASMASIAAAFVYGVQCGRIEEY
jgi:hypothetical protein